jgi:zinc transport system substrate-binding protein
MIRIYLKSISLLLPLVLCGFLLPPASVFSQTPMPVAVSIIPQKYFVEKIGGQLVEIEVMVPPGATPEQYEPKPKQMAAISKSRVYFACGVPFETIWLPKFVAANPKMLVIQTEKEIEKRQIEAHSHEGHVENSSVGHTHGEEDARDPHVWLSPPLVMLQARAIFETLTAGDPQNRQSYETNYKNFISELVDLDLSISRLFPSQSESISFMVFHPAWGYFADAYGLKQVPVEIEGKEPKAKDLDNFIKRAKELKIKTIFVQPQYSPRSAQTIADAIGGKLVHADDLAPDWANNLRQVAEQIAANLGLQ